jgi:hypothetical protein
MAIREPDETQHVAIAGRTGSGKTTAGLEMLSKRDMEGMAWVVIDHKRDENIKALPAETLNPNTMMLPQRGLHVVYADISSDSKENLEGLFHRAFRRGNIGFYIDEGHLLGNSPALRHILVAGRSKRVPVMWTSQRAAWIDPFIWSQASFYRVFQLQTEADRKRFNENFPMKYTQPAEYHSYYYDVSKGNLAYLAPAGEFDNTLNRLTSKLKVQYKAV